MASDKKQIRSSVLGVRLEEGYVKALENEANSKGTTKSRVARGIIQNYFHFIKPRRDYEKITMGRNMFLLCLETLGEEGLQKFSEMGISNALKEQNVLGSRFSLNDLLEQGRMEEFYAEVVELMADSYGLYGLGWLTSLDYRYIQEKECAYLKFNHDLNMTFSNYLLWHFPEIIRRTSDMEWKVLDHAITDTKLEIYLQIIPKVDK